MWLSCRFSLNILFTNTLTEFGSALMCNTGKKSIATETFACFTSEKVFVCLFFCSYVTTRESRTKKKKCAWELVNRSDFFHSNRTLNLFPLSNRVSLSHCISHTLVATNGIVGKVFFTSFSESYVWLRSSYRSHARGLHSTGENRFTCIKMLTRKL